MRIRGARQAYKEIVISGAGHVGRASACALSCARVDCGVSTRCLEWKMGELAVGWQSQVREDGGNVCELVAGLGYRLRAHLGDLAVFWKNSQAASKRRWREGFPRCQRWSLAPIVRTGSPNLR